MTRWDDPSSDPLQDLRDAYEHFRHRYVAGVDFSDLQETLTDGYMGCTGTLCECGVDHVSVMREHLDRTPSGEHTSADTDDVVAGIDAAMEDWEREAARWSPDGSHEHDPPHWTRMDYGNGAMSRQADWGCDDVTERMRPGSTACFPWPEADRDPDLAERLAHAIITIDRWRRRIGR